MVKKEKSLIVKSALRSGATSKENGSNSNLSKNSNGMLLN
jgi:hypothetical protein